MYIIFVKAAEHVSQNTLLISVFSHLAFKKMLHHIDGLVKDGSNSIANAPELLQSCTKP